MLRKTKSFFKVSSAERNLFLLALWYSAIARILILFIPFRKYSFWLGKYGTETPESEIKDLCYIKMVDDSVRRASKITPWRFKCLEQAMTAKKLLNRKGIKSTIYFGVNKKEGKIIAHSWLRCGNYFVTGGKNRNDFVKVSWFS